MSEPHAQPFPSPTWRRRIVLGLTITFFCGPVLVDLIASDERRPFAYVAADSFYYLTVARNMADHGRVSFDQQHATNGFHPLWQLTLGASYATGRLFGLADHQMVAVAVLLSLLLIGVGLWFLLRAASVATEGRLTPLWLILPVGVYAIAVSPMWLSFSPAELARQNLGEGSQPLYGTLWSYVNGMETGAVLGVYGALAWSYVTRPYLDRDRDAAIFGGLLALLVFARLDHLFIAGIFALAVITRAGLEPSRPVLRRSAIALGAFAVPIVLYMLINNAYFGSPVPLSGKLKSTFPFLSNDFIHLWKAMDRHVKGGKWLALAWRITQLAVPMAVALCYLPFAFRLRRADGGISLSFRRPRDRFDRFCALTAPGVALLGLYGFLFVPHGHHGHWYYPVSTLFVSLAVVQVLSHLRISRLLARRWVLLGWVVLCSAVSLFYFARLHVTPDYHRRYAAFFFDEAPRVRQHYRGQRPRLYSVDDGIVAFATGFPTMSGTGLNTDRVGFHHRKAKRLGELAVRRGYRHFTSFIYWNANPGRLHPRTRSAHIGRWLSRSYQLRSPHRYHFSIDYRSQHLRFAIIRVRPK